jgi:hypothetical protein
MKKKMVDILQNQGRKMQNNKMKVKMHLQRKNTQDLQKLIILREKHYHNMKD